jgi:hypothetical protein
LRDQIFRPRPGPFIDRLDRRQAGVLADCRGGRLLQLREGGADLRRAAKVPESRERRPGRKRLDVRQKRLFRAVGEGAKLCFDVAEVAAGIADAVEDAVELEIGDADFADRAEEPRFSGDDEGVAEVPTSIPRCRYKKQLSRWKYRRDFIIDYDNPPS